jgi:hypothetical protein
MAGRFTPGIRAVSCLSAVALAAPLLLGTLVGCRRTPEPSGSGSDPGSSSGSPLSPSPKETPASPPMASSTPPVEITWVDPPGLRRVPPKNAMRKASYEVPHAGKDTEDGELAVFYFGPGQGGGIEQNVDRWVKQFSGVQPSDVKRADRQANGLRQHTVEIAHGTFESGMPGMGPSGPKKDYALEGAIVEAPSGAYFFKMTGPAATVAAARAAFMQLLDSVRAG